MIKFNFSLKTRDGHQIINVQIYGNDATHAESKLRQMYRHCEILDCVAIDTEKNTTNSMDIEDLLTLIAKEH